MKWQWLQDAFRRRIRFRITGAGVLFFLALLFVGFASFLTANNLLFLVFSAMLAMLLVSGFLSRLMLSGLELELLLPEHVSARTATPARVRLRNLKRLTPSFSLELSGPSLRDPVYFPLIPGGATAEAAVEVTFPHRGRHKENVFQIATRFPFGFLRKTTTLALERETIVYPAMEPFEEAESLLAHARLGDTSAMVHGPGGDFYRIRPYLHGDNARHIDWKSSAHTGIPHVREFSQEEDGAVEIFLDRRTAAGDTRLFEVAVERCAFLVAELAASETGLLFRAQGFARVAPEDGDFYAILKYLALVEPLIAVTSVPESESHFVAGRLRIVFSPRPEDFEATEWAAAFFV